MGIFRKKTKIQVWALKAAASRAIYNHRDLPTIDVTVTVADNDADKRSDLTEITISLTAWEAGQLAGQLSNSVNAILPMIKPTAAHGNWGEGAGS